MSEQRLIDAKKAIESIDEIVCSMSVCINSDYCNGMRAMKKAAIRAIEKQPTTSAVPVVRCNDCDHMKWKKSIYADGTINRCRRCELDNKEHPNDWFCADGKPKGVIED